MNILSKNEHKSLQIWLKELKEFQLDSMFETNVLGRAYLYKNSITINKNNPNSVSGIVEGKQYEVQIISDNNVVKGNCSCPFEGNCKHLAALVLVLLSSP